MAIQDERFILSGYVSCHNEEGFGIPIFEGTKSHSFFFQDVARHDFDTIAGFTLIEGYNLSAIKSIGKETMDHFGKIKIGDNAIYMFETKTHVFFDVRAGFYKIFNELINNGMITNSYIIKDIRGHFYSNFNVEKAHKLNAEVEDIIFQKVRVSAEATTTY